MAENLGIDYGVSHYDWCDSSDSETFLNDGIQVGLVTDDAVDCWLTILILLVMLVKCSSEFVLDVLMSGKEFEGPDHGS